ncbi:hypothetical protein Tco_0252559 [Tanacetum coccineum]
MVQAVGSWKPNKELPAKSKECEHEWKENTVTNYTICYYCELLTTDMSRLNCPKCQLTTCALCARNYLDKTVNMIRDQAKEYYENKAVIQKKEEIWQSKESLLVRDLTDALKIIDQLRIEKERLEKQKNEEIRELKAQLQKKKRRHADVSFLEKEFSTLGKHYIANLHRDESSLNSGNATTSIELGRKNITNQLLQMLS